MIKHIQSAPPIWEYPSYSPTQKVAIFVPCYIDQFFPHVAQAMVEILDRLGVKVDFPPARRNASELPPGPKFIILLIFILFFHIGFFKKSLSCGAPLLSAPFKSAHEGLFEKPLEFEERAFFFLYRLYKRKPYSCAVRRKAIGENLVADSQNLVPF